MKHSKFDFMNDTKFKQFLRKELDKNENRNDQDLGKFEVWFEFVKTCEQIIEHNETDLKTISELMIKMNNKFLKRPPHGFNIALGNQKNRQKLVQHCTKLQETCGHMNPDKDLLKDGFYFIADKLEDRYVIFNRFYKHRKEY